MTVEAAGTRTEIKVAPIIQIGLLNINVGEFTMFAWKGSSTLNLKVGIGRERGESAGAGAGPSRAGTIGEEVLIDAPDALQSKELDTEYSDRRRHRFVPPSRDGFYRIERDFVPSVVNWDALHAEQGRTTCTEITLPNGAAARMYSLGSAKLLARTREIRFDEDEILRSGQYVVVTIDDPQRGREHFILLPPPPGRSEDRPEAEIPIADRTFEAGKRQFTLDWPPVRLGDGSYGAVFKVQDESLTPFALKVLYERQFLTRTGLMSVRVSDLAKLQGQPGPESSDDVVTQVPFDDVVNLLLGAMDRAAKGDAAMMKSSVEDLQRAVIEAFAFSQERTNLSRLRFDAERKVAEDIRRAFRAREAEVSDTQPGDYVEAVASTDQFKQSKAYEALQKYYRTQSGPEHKPVNLSNYGIVLAYCNFTLKDLLEREWLVKLGDGGVSIRTAPLVTRHEASESRREGETEIRLLGYDLLGKLPYSNRVRVILPYLKGVARGLYTLYLAGKSHHDIKPGNVFIRKGPTAFQALLGDFSFVAQAAEVGTTEAVLRDVISTGTMHFRSPEQRDFTEVYQALVVHSTRDPRFRLRVRDPKFRDPKGRQDRLVFSSDREGTLYTIDQATKRDEDNYWEIRLKAEDAVLGAKFPSSPQPTQVVIYRMPTVHSDLFGFGALAYDLVSAGGSAERFYERLRSVDYYESPYTVDGLVDEYERSSGFNPFHRLDPALKEIFASFQNGDDVCPPDVVKLILRCMCHRIEGALAREHEEREADETPFRIILRELEGPIDERVHSNDRNENLLIEAERSPEWDIIRARLLTEHGAER